MSALLAECAQAVRRLYAGIEQLAGCVSALGLAPLEGREWYELLVRKLLPQLADESYLVVAVVGGTNIGKSVVFNHIAGQRASATSPLASGTKHPVCLVPEAFPARDRLEEIFQGFVLYEWDDAEAALEESAEHRLFWRTSDRSPSNLLVLDTPDIDSDAVVNWHRADRIRHTADVLVAVLTQQKYNDAAVKRFFREAAREDKAVIVVFNQCQWPEDDQYWPLWLKTFCGETGIVPELIYVAPNDRRAAEENRLPFFARPNPLAATSGVSGDGQPHPSDVPHESADDEPHDLMEDLSHLHFAEIKWRTLRGSLARVVDAEDGVPAWLREIEVRSREFAAAADLLTAHHLAEIEQWPPVPNALMVREVRRWWQAQRTGWARAVHGFYNAVGQGVTWPARATRRLWKGHEVPPIEQYRQREWRAIVDTVGSVFRRLAWIAELGNEQLKPRLERLLAGTSRAQLLQKLEQEHSLVDLESELAGVVASEMERFRQESPRFYEFLKRLDKTAAAVRPAASIVLFVTGLGPIGDAAAHFFTESAVQTVVHVAGDVAGGTVAAAAGDTALSSTTSTTAGYIESRFRRLHSVFAAQRAAWLGEQLKQHLLGELPAEIQQAAAIPQSEAFQEVARTLAMLRQTGLAAATAATIEPKAESTGTTASSRESV